MIFKAVRNEENVLRHHGTKGMKWGKWNAETAARYSRKDRIFVSGSSKTQNKESGYYRRKLPSEVRRDIKQGIKAGSTFLVGDAPGIDRQVQDYLKQKNYKNVEVYGPGKNVRYQADKTWKSKPIDAPQYEKGSKEWLREKDIAMTKDSTKGLAVILDDGANATRNNVKRLKQQGKGVKVYALSNNKKQDDNWVYSDDVIKDRVKERLMTLR